MVTRRRAVHRRLAGRVAYKHVREEPIAAVAAQPRRPARPRADHPDRAGQGPRPPLPDRRRPARRPPALPPRPAARRRAGHRDRRRGPDAATATRRRRRARTRATVATPRGRRPRPCDRGARRTRASAQPRADHGSLTLLGARRGRRRHPLRGDASSASSQATGRRCPNVVGKTVDAARAASWPTQHLSCDVKTRRDATEPVDTVVAPGSRRRHERVERSSTVDAHRERRRGDEARSRPTSTGQTVADVNERAHERAASR